MSSSPDSSRVPSGIAVSTLGVLLVHVLLGWAWTPAGAAVGGYVARRYGVWVGAVGGLLSWAILAFWSWSVDPRATREMMRVVAELLGSLPPAATVVVTLLVGMTLGVAGGLVGQTARNLAGALRR